MRTIMALLPADCAFELMFDQLSKGLRNTANIHFGELHTSELAGGRGYLRTYFPLPVWGKQVLTSESSLMQARMAPLPFLSFDVDDSGPLNPERSIRFRARIRTIPLGDGWTPVSVPANSREAVNRNLQTYYCAQEILLGLEKDALRASNWTGEMQAALVQAAQEAMTKELPDSYNAFSQALADLRVFRHRDIFAAKLKDLYLKLWDAPLMAERWRKLTHDMIQCPDQRALLEQEAGLSNAERDIIADAKLDELALAKREWLSRRLFRIIAIDDHQLTIEIPMLELDQMPVLRRDLVPGVLQPHLRPELLLEAYVNVNAANASEIRFHDIRLPLDQTVP
ncbi:MAG: hypothetical protein JNM66_21730 [Bryobacterales bacterium]|nr:hypothetical protein [Bryobacterales bacterium]